MKSIDTRLINVWNIAFEKLGIQVETEVKLNTANGKVVIPVLVKYFGSKKGTIIVHQDVFMDYPMPKGYYYCTINASSYPKYNENDFKKELKDWGYRGAEENKPKWLLNEDT